MDEFEFKKVFSSVDEHGRYAYANQMPIAQWNLARLAETLLLLCDARSDFEAILSEFPAYYDSCYLELMRPKLGLMGTNDGDAELIGKWLNAGVMDGNQLFHPHTGTPQGGVISPLLANIYLHEVLDDWFARRVQPLTYQSEQYSVAYPLAQDFS